MGALSKVVGFLTSVGIFYIVYKMLGWVWSALTSATGLGAVVGYGILFIVLIVAAIYLIFLAVFVCIVGLIRLAQEN